MPGMGVNSWGGSPLREISIGNREPKARAIPRGVVRRKPEARPASRRTETAYKAQPRGKSAQQDEAHLIEGNVNAAVVQGKLTHLIRGDLPGIGCPKRLRTVRRGGRRRPPVFGQESAAAIVARTLCESREQRRAKEQSAELRSQRNAAPQSRQKQAGATTSVTT